MGGLVQQPAALGAHRQHPAGRSRGTLLRHAGTTCHGGVTQTKWPPTNPGRFKAPAALMWTRFIVRRRRQTASRPPLAMISPGRPAPTTGPGACTGDDAPLDISGAPLEIKPTPSNHPVGACEFAYANNIQLPGVGS